VKLAVRIILFLAAAILAWLVWSWMHPSPERAINRQLEKLQDSLAIKPGEGNIARVSAINRAISLFTPDVVINTEGIPQMGDAIQGRTELQQALFTARSQLQGEVNFSDIHITVGPNETNAVVNFTAVARIANQKEPYSQDIKAQFVYMDRDWLISRVDPIALRAAPAAEK
jgi:hypothetical protein